MNRPSKDPSFSIFEFKSWLAKQPEFSCSFDDAKKSNVLSDLIGNMVESRLGLVRLQSQITSHNPELTPDIVEKRARVFKERGGLVKDVADLALIIELRSGATFALPKIYTKPSS